MPQPYELWWSVVPGPSQLVEQLTAHLVRFESALIPYTTASFPWGEEFRLSAYDRVRQVHPNLTEELCDASTMGELLAGGCWTWWAEGKSSACPPMTPLRSQRRAVC